MGSVPSLACAMIVREAAGTLERALKSVRPHVDELVIVDTGSEDDTVAIAGRYADCLVGLQWPDHFAQARQHAHDLCSAEWVMHLDADDELIQGWNLKPLIAAARPELTAYMLRYQLLDGDGGHPTIDYWRERLVRRGAYRWAGRIHETLVPIHPGPYERSPHAHVLHHGSGDPLAKLQRNIRLLELAYADDPHDSRTTFYLGRDLVAAGDRDRGREYLECYLTLSNWPDEAYIARQLIGDCLRHAGDYGAAYRSDLELLDIKPLWPQGYFALAKDCYHLQRWPECVHFCDIGRRLPAPETNLFVDRGELEHGWMIYQAVALHNAGRTEEAAELTAAALRLRPNDPSHLFNANFFAVKLGQLAAAPAAGPKGR